jgi:HAD superfamily hydrolase (TIGR01509 family)
MSFAVIFDMDGVIINNNDWHLRSWMEYAQKLGIDLKPEEFPTRVFGKTNEQILAAAFPEASEAQLVAWSLEKEALYRKMYEPDFQLAEGLLDFLIRLKENKIKVAVASNAPLVNVDFALDLGKIRPYFDVVMYAGLVAKPKPAPDIYLKSAELLGKNPKECFVIEDSPTGLQAAVEAGCKPIAITSTYHEAGLRTLTNQVFSDFESIGNHVFGS